MKVWGENVQEDGVAASCGGEAVGSGGGMGAQAAHRVGESAIRPQPGVAKDLDAQVLSSGEELSGR